MDHTHEDVNGDLICKHCGRRLIEPPAPSKKLFALQCVTVLFLLVILFGIMSVLFVWAFDHPGG